MRLHLTVLFIFLFGLTALNAQKADWSFVVGGDSPVKPLRIKADQAGNVYTLGYFSGTVDFDHGSGIAELSATTDNVFLLKTSPSGAFLWVRKISAFGVLGTFFDLDNLGNPFLAGEIWGTEDVDPGPGVFTLSSTDGATFLLKLDPDGHFVWAGLLESLENGGLNSPNQFISDQNNGFYISGSMSAGNMDFDPGPGQFIRQAPVAGRYIAKYDADGRPAWVNIWAPLTNISVKEMAADPQGNLVFAGEYRDDIDFDPGPGMALLGQAIGQRDIFIQKFDSSGQFLWVKGIHGNQWEYAESMALDQNGNIILFGTFQYTVDFDPDSTEYTITTTDFSPDLFLEKLDADGHLLWVNQVDATMAIGALSVGVDESGNIFTGGQISGSQADFDPGPGIIQLSAQPGESNAFFMKSDFLGNTVWAHQIRGGNSRTTALYPSPNGHVYYAVSVQYPGQLFLESDTIPIPAVINNLFVLDLVHEIRVSGRIFYDANENDIQDGQEPGIANAGLSAQPHNRHSVSSPNGHFNFYYDVTGDTIRPQLSWPQMSVSPAFVVVDTAQTPIQFAVSGPIVRDLCISMVETTPFRPGFNTHIALQVSNIGLAPADSVPVKLILVEPLTPPLELLALGTPATYLGDHEWQWIIPHIGIGQTVQIDVWLKTPITASNGTQIVLSSTVFEPNDVNDRNNGSRIVTQTVGSYDPNDKTVTPKNADPVALDSTGLRYVIRFQNTGTYRADFVMVRDTLPAGLDLSSLRVLGASHPFNWRFIGANVLEFRFDPINLPDSSSNEPGSHGFVAFSVKTLAGLPVGTQINNRAGIYFDYNPPIITADAVLQVIAVGTSEPGNADRLDLVLSPNPVAAHARFKVQLPEYEGLASLVVADAGGRILRRMDGLSGGRKVDMNGLPAGAYVLHLRAGRKSGFAVLVVQ
jgi:hypothetical protein